MRHFNKNALLMTVLLPLMAQALPFEPTTDPAASTTKWYQIKTGTHYMYSNHASWDDVYPSTTASTDDYYLWCFVGTASTGYTIYNRGARAYINGLFVSGSSGDNDLSYVEMASGNNFYIYYNDRLGQVTQKMYIYYDSDNNCFSGTNGKVDTFTSIEVAIEPPTPPTELPYETLTATDYHVPHNVLSNTGVEGYAKLIDQNKSTKWCVVNNSGAWETIWLEFESDGWFIPDGYVFTTGNDTKSVPNRNPKEWVIYGKTFEDDQWTELAHVTDGAGLGSENTTDYSFDITGASVGYRYFRFEVRQINGKDTGDNNYTFQLAELQFTGTKVDEPNILPYESLTATGYNIPHNTMSNTGVEGYAKLIDQNKSTKWCVVNNSGAWETIWLEFESDGWFIPDGYVFTTGNDTKSVPNRNPKEWVIYGKTFEDDQWTELAHVTDGAGLGSENTTDYSFDITGASVGYRYFRFEVRQINGKNTGDNTYTFQLAELQFTGTKVDEPTPTPGDVTGDGQVDIADVNAVINMMLGKASPTAAGDVTGDNSVDIADVNAVINIMLGKTPPSGGDPTAQSLTATGYNIPHNGIDNEGNEGYAKLVDGNKSTKWCVENKSGAWETIWVDLKSSVPFKPTSYIMTTGNDTHSFYTRNPKNWKIYGRNSESESWTELAHVTDGTGLGTANTTDYTFEFNGVTKAYQYYRFEVIEIGGKYRWDSNNYVFQLAELTLLGVAAQ